MSYLTLVGSHSVPRTGGEGVHWSFTGVGDSTRLIQVLSRNILSVHWARVATRGDGEGLEKGCDVSIIKQHVRFFEKTLMPASWLFMSM